MNKLSPVLIRALIVFGSILVSSLVVVTASYTYMDGVYRDKLAAQRAMHIWKSKIDRSVEKNQVIDKFENDFLKLVNQGVVGDENRLSWFETIQNTARKRGMPLVKYSISTQEKLDEANLKKDYKGIDVYKSLMTLDIKMAHEGDLFALLNNLRNADGLYAVEKCDISKIDTRDNNTMDKLKAFCELGWYTFRAASAKADKRR